MTNKELLLIYTDLEVENPFYDNDNSYDYYSRQKVICESEWDIWVSKEEALNRVAKKLIKEKNLKGRAINKLKKEIENIISEYELNYKDELEENYIIKTLYSCFETEAKEDILKRIKEDIEEDIKEMERLDKLLDLIVYHPEQLEKINNSLSLNIEQTESNTKNLRFSGFTF